MSRKYFGTDGIRGRVGQFPITPEFVLKLGWAAGVAFRREGVCRVLIGKDTRVSGYMFESALQAGLVAAGADVMLLGPMPTPAIAYLTRTFHAEAGIVISASHNPYYDNGIKFFSDQGTKLPDDIEARIEALLDEPMVVAESIGKVTRINDAAGRYIEFCKSSVPTSTRFSGLKLVVDCANGATYKVAPSVFRELGATVSVLSAQPDGLNINEACGSTHMEALQAEVISQGADLGIAFDGDGDRVLMVDHAGRLVDGDQLLFIIARDLKERGLLGDGGIVGTLMSNLGLELALADLQIPFVRAKVGDRYVMAELQERGWKQGGENSGHIVCCRHTTTGDAIIAALQVLLSLKRRGENLRQASDGVRMCPQVLVNVRFKGGMDPVENPSVQEACDEVTRKMAGRGRVLLRKSGTEPLVRVMVEGDDAVQVREYAEALAKVVAEACA
jgi:phosphoglucosamine mutase